MTTRKKDLRKNPHRIHPNSLKALRETSVPFKKNNTETGERDERINRKGSPNTTSSMRALVRSLGEDLTMLEDPTVRGKRRTTIVSRVTKMLMDMYSSSNPADRTAILKAGWPGLLEGEEKGPKEYVLKIVYENRRADGVGDEELDAIDGEVSGPGPEEEPGAGVGVGQKLGVGVPDARIGLDFQNTQNETHHTGKDGHKYPSRKGNAPEGEFFCVLCQDFREQPATSSILHGGWICRLHQDPSS